MNGWSIFFFGGLGALSRYFVSGVTGDLGFWVGTFCVNLVGSMVLGICSVLLTEGQPDWIRLGVTLGFLGGFTTFSAFSLDIWRWVESGEIAKALAYSVGTVLLGFGSLILGREVARHLLNSTGL